MPAFFPASRSYLYCSLAIFLPLTSFAEDTLVVTAKPADTAETATHGYEASTSQGATKTDRPLILTAQSVSVVTRQQMSDQGALTVNDALKYTPGVFTNFSGGATRYDTIALRGFHGGDVNNTFLNGLRLLSDGGSYNALQIDPWFLERIDVIKGPSSVMYGQSIPGGLVAMTSKRPQFASENHVNVMAGNNNTKGGAFDSTGALNDQWAYRLTGITRTSDTMYDHQREERYAISPSLLWQPDENTSLLLQANLQKDPSGGYHSAVPSDGSIYTTSGDKLGRGFFDGESSRNVFKRWQQIYSYDFSHSFNDVWSFRQNASYTHSNVELEQVYQIGWNADRSELNRWYSGSNTSLDAYAVDNQLAAEFATGALEHKVMLGLDYQRFTNNLWEESGSATPLNPFTGVSGGPDINILSHTDSKRRYEQTGVYLQDEVSLYNWYLNLSGRVDRLETKNTVLNTDSTDARTDDHFTGRASLLYHFDSGFSPYMSYSSAVTPAVLADKEGHLLKPTTSEQYEAGLKYQPPGSSSIYSIALYDLTQNDVANRVVKDSYYVPAGKVHSQGIELEARSQVSERLNVIAGYSYNKVKFKDAVDGNDGNTPYLAPNQMASLWGQYKAGLGINLGAGVRYIGKQWADNENTLRIPSVTLLDASVRMDLDSVKPSLKGAYVQLNANNLTDREYVAGCYGTGYCYWGAGRSVIATVGYDF
ncbi:TonB-dependent siderophore receptor [Serratia fonticola]|uniref:TonB-dependent siderophore receptor n=1 Tax=Serratia fonticola TaxID=47917 RepID=UPI00217C34B4|nr:TonB-dependent siderophore receptor [Serratia fonticola]CAI1159594.1 Ferric hydroxamate uptake [Serratia fonticola]CAI1163945.1 Ferric hydroxamate uptake [Serratia fonticola]CAI1568012.1 Ferric hydroxamate uptake [Serratia fonticola]CAI1681791.1 Ferric hydroxamate uptake [Serratia fonticola]CAI1723014.1 Ferric hydroxamate uptake [Serratia fonticola]